MTIILEHNTVKLKQKAWHGDCPLMLSFPAAWQVELIGDQALPALTAADLQAAIKRPIESPSLGSLAQGKSNAIILIDDLSRPTPAADLLPPVIDELLSAGLRAEQISILSAGGTHPPDEQEALAKKTGILPDGIQVYTHNSHNDLAALGITKQGTPIHINQKVANSDLKIGIGCIYPHPAAGFSGGAKIIAPGAAGSDTIRIMHDKCRGAQHRAGSIETEFRQEISEIAERVGLNFIVNVTLNQQRSISGIFAGHPQHAFEQGVAFARQQYSVPPPPHADIIIADMYPFDIDFQVAFDRGLWPIEMAGRSTTKVLLASCPQGMGEHELFPVSDPFFPRLKRRLQSLSPADLFRLGIRLRAIKKIIRRKQMQVFILSQSLQEGDLKKSLPQSQILPDWESLLQVLLQKHDENCPVQVVIYRCAPLMLPTSKGEK
jgi:lactate racemase